MQLTIPPPLFKSLLLLLLTTLLYSAGTTQQTEKSFLWELTYGTKRVYLLGSIHVARQDLFPLKHPIETAYNSADAIAVEVDLDKATHIMPLLLQQHAFLPPEKSITDIISPDSTALLQKHLKKIHLDFERLKQMKPWYLSILISNISLERIGARSYLGIDQYFTSRAYRDGKEVVELEGAAAQLRMLDSLPFEEQEYLMRSSILDDARMETVFEEMVRLWRQGDIKGLAAFFEEELAGYPELKAFNQKLITQRNKTLTEKIVELMQRNDTLLIIIGAAHFTGKDGIIKRLEKRGFTPVQQ
jgi:uncharacterized protein YbaP (TraB family)